MSALTGGGGPGGPGGLGGGPGGPGGAPGGKAVNSFKKAVTIKVSKLHSFFDGTIDLPNAEYFSRPALATTAVPRTQSRSSTAGKNQFKGDSPASHFESCHLKKTFFTRFFIRNRGGGGGGDPQGNGGGGNGDDASYGGYHLSYEVKKLM